MKARVETGQHSALSKARSSVPDEGSLFSSVTEKVSTRMRLR